MFIHSNELHINASLISFVPSFLGVAIERRIKERLCRRTPQQQPLGPDAKAALCSHTDQPPLQLFQLFL